MHKEAGFTLIEVIVTLIIAGILASIAGMGIVQGIKGYVFALENSAITQKAELAMARMSLELRDISDIIEDPDLDPDSDSTAIFYTKDSSDHEIVFDNNQVTIDSNVLINKVADFKLVYYKSNDDDEINQLIEADNPVDDLIARIDIELILQHAEGNIIFKTMINPRNIF